MAQAVGDPEELRIFADKLQRYLEILDEETNHLTATFEQLEIPGMIAREMSLQ